MDTRSISIYHIYSYTNMYRKKDELNEMKKNLNITSAAKVFIMSKKIMKQ